MAHNQSDWLHWGDLRWTQWWAIAPLLLGGGVVVGLAYGDVPLLGFAVGVMIGLVAHQIFLGAMRWYIGRERSSVADLLTIGRMTAGTLIIGLLASGTHARGGPAEMLGLGLTVIGATALDWLDGPLARRCGPTQLGAVLDIEADSWLTLWSAVGAVVWGGLPWLCVLPPIAHYLHPWLALRQGRLPAGGGPWWSRITGTAQMLLIVAALLPWHGPLRGQILSLSAYPISSAQLFTMLVLLLPRYAPAATTR